MRSELFASTSILFFICSCVYFLHIAGPVYTPEAEPSYFIDTVYAVAVPLFISVFFAFFLWLIKRRSFAKYLSNFITAFFSIGIVALLFITFLIVETSA